MSNVKEVDAPEFKTAVLDSNLPVLVDFWAPWCGPCRMMAPVLDELSTEMGDRLRVVKVNVEEAENQNLAMQYNIQSIPNMKLFKDGNVAREFIGFKPKDVLRGELEGLIN